MTNTFEWLLSDDMEPYSPKTYQSSANLKNLTAYNFLQGYSQIEGIKISVSYNPYVINDFTEELGNNKIMVVI